MQIIIPMSGMGNRFVDAGYKTPKPLIEIDGMPIIEHVVKMFPGEEDFIFICNSTHLRETNIRELLLNLAPKSQIVEIAPHKKGPVYAVQCVASLIADEEEVIVNYCDFSCYWDYEDFLRHTRLRRADGAIPAYKGFHPHMLGTTNYAFMRDHQQWMTEIKEKEPFTDDRTREYASTGTYYFRKGAFVKKYFKELIQKGIDLNGEYYVSLVYNLLKADNLTVSIYDIQHMLQWGTPRDVEEYLIFSNYFRAICERKTSFGPYEENGLNLIPLAGRGSRFSGEGYSDPKPLIKVGGKPMIVQAADYLPGASRNTFVCLEEHLQKYPLENAIKKAYPSARIVSIDQITEGQACTCEIGLYGEDQNAPLLIAACDNGMLWNNTKYEALISDAKVDAIVWSFRNHPGSKRNPEMYGWIVVNDRDDVTGVSVKKAISDSPENDHAIVGTFYFRKTAYFTESLQRLYKKNIRVNGEFYVDSCVDEMVAMGLKVKVFELEHYIGWGTPDDYRSFLYWQSFFHKADWHPYRMEKDRTIHPAALAALEKEYNAFEQAYR